MTHCFHTYTCRIYILGSVRVFGLWVLAHSYPPPKNLSLICLFIRPAFCYRLPPDPLLPRRPCQIATSYPASGETVDLHHQQYSLSGQWAFCMPQALHKVANLASLLWIKHISLKTLKIPLLSLRSFFDPMTGRDIAGEHVFNVLIGNSNVITH